MQIEEAMHQLPVKKGKVFLRRKTSQDGTHWEVQLLDPITCTISVTWIAFKNARSL